MDQSWPLEVEKIPPVLSVSGQPILLLSVVDVVLASIRARIKKNRDGENETPIHYNLRKLSSYRRFSGQDRSIILWSPRVRLQISHACLIGWSSSRWGSS